MMKLHLSLWGLMGVLGATSVAGAAVYEQDFSAVEVGEVPTEFLVLDGQFAVQDFMGDKALVLPGAPLETFGVLFGPSAQDGLTVSGRVQGTGKGRRFPAFAVSLGGVSGFRLQVAPAKQAVELLHGDQTVAAVPWEWTSGSWTRLLLRISKTGESTWQVAGKVWTEGTTEPADWTITLTPKQPPVSGKAGVWGKPFSGTPIVYDDLKVEKEGL